MLDSNFWKRYFQVYDFLKLLIPYQELIDTICDELDIKIGEKILEAGCGTGNLALKIKEKGAEVIGLDNSQEALDIYRKKDPQADLVLSDLRQKLPFPDNYFDKIASNNTLYIIPKDQQLSAVRELHRILKPKGKIVIANLKKGWNSRKIYTRGIRENIRRKGIYNSIIKIFGLIIPTSKVFYYNFLIKKESEYHFPDINEQKEILEQSGFRDISETKLVYADQTILNSAFK